MARKGTHKYNKRSRVNHAKKFKNTPKMFKMNTADTSTIHIYTDYISHTYPPKNTITVEPLAKKINCETTGKILGYRDLVNMDAPVWTNTMCNELGRLSQGWKEHTGTDTIELILNKEKQKYRRETYMRALCDIQTQIIDTHRTRLTSGENIIYYPGEVSTPTLDLNTMKLHVNSTIQEIKFR